jgi:hypothetical protein
MQNTVELCWKGANLFDVDVAVDVDESQYFPNQYFIHQGTERGPPKLSN